MLLCTDPRQSQLLKEEFDLFYEKYEQKRVTWPDSQ